MAEAADGAVESRSRAAVRQAIRRAVTVADDATLAGAVAGPNESAECCPHNKDREGTGARVLLPIYSLEADRAQAEATPATPEVPDDCQVERVYLPARALRECNQRVPVTIVRSIRRGLARATSRDAASRRLAASSDDARCESTASDATSSAGSEHDEALHAKKHAVVVWLHATGSSAALMVPRLVEYARLGFLAVAIDTRYHGERAGGPCSRTSYQDAVYRAWRDRQERPFLLDNLADLQTLLSYLEHRPDVDPSRIGMAGISLGGMHTWLCAALDDRVAAAAPLIGVQNFRWAVENEAYHGRVDSLRGAFSQILRECGKAEPDAELVRGVWDVILPGLMDEYDAAHSLPLVAPRPLLVVNGELDPRCPIDGLHEVVKKCRHAYEECGSGECFRMHIEPGAGHEVTRSMDEVVQSFFIQHLLT